MTRYEIHTRHATGGTGDSCLPEFHGMDVWTDTPYIHMTQILDLLNEHYIGDPTGLRVRFTKEQLMWLIEGAHTQTVTDSNTHEVIGFMSCRPIDMMVHDKPRRAGLLDLSCIHPGYRKKGLAYKITDLFSDLCRKVHGVQSLVCTSSAGDLSKNVVTGIVYYHRPLKILRLIKAGFTRHPRSAESSRNPDKVAELVWRLKSPDFVRFRRIESKDIKSVSKFMAACARPDGISTVPRVTSLKRWLYRSGIVDTWVSLDEESKISGIVSWTLAGSYNSMTGMQLTRATCGMVECTDPKDRSQIIRDAMYVAHQDGADVWTMTNIDNLTNVVEELGMEVGTGSLGMYFTGAEVATITHGDLHVHHMVG